MKAPIVGALLVVSLGLDAHAMVRHVAIFEPSVSLQEFDAWYFGTHTQECIRFYGPWLRRYETYRSSLVPKEADRFNVYRGRYTELWYDSADAFREAAPNDRPYSPPPFGAMYSRERPTARLLIPAMPTEDFLGKAPAPRDGPFLRWLVMIRYPDGVSVDDGETWYLTVHAQEEKRLPGLLKAVSYKAVPSSPLASPWVRLTELWFKDYDAWRIAVLQTDAKYTAPPWAAAKGRWLETVSTFVQDNPEKDFLRQ